MLWGGQLVSLCSLACGRAYKIVWERKEIIKAVSQLCDRKAEVCARSKSRLEGNAVRNTSEEFAKWGPVCWYSVVVKFGGM